MNSILETTWLSPQGEREGRRVKCLEASRLLAFVTRGERKHGRKF